MTVMAILPFPFSIRQVKTSQDPIIETVNEPITRDDMGKFGFEIAVLPKFFGRLPALRVGSHLQENATSAEAGREKHSVIFQCNGLRTLRPFIICPRIFPEDRAIFWIVSRNTRGID